MYSIYRSLLLVIAGATQKELARQVQYLKTENDILRSKLPVRITILPKERQRLLKFGARLGKAIHQVVTIVTPGTFLRWIREDKRRRKTKQAPAKRGRRRTAEDIRKLIVKMARENTWGYTRIVGELKKLGIRSVAKTTVRNILKEHGLDPCPKRAGSTWDEFLSRHAASLWQCDFVSQKVLTVRGIREAFFLAFLNVQTRRTVLSPATFHPDEAWVQAQAVSFLKQARSERLRVRYVQHDRDTKFTQGFDAVLRRSHVRQVRGPKCAPNCQAFVERFLGSLRRECLHHFVFFGLVHLDCVARCWLEHYHQERPHQGLDNELLIKPNTSTRSRETSTAESRIMLSDIRCLTRLGGLLRTYSCKAA
jgi:putative transposase